MEALFHNRVRRRILTVFISHKTLAVVIFYRKTRLQKMDKNNHLLHNNLRLGLRGLMPSALLTQMVGAAIKERTRDHLLTALGRDRR
jgi:hypothetical protein